MYIYNESIFNTNRNMPLRYLPFLLYCKSRTSFHANRQGSAFLFAMAAWFCHIMKYCIFLNIGLFNFFYSGYLACPVFANTVCPFLN